MKVSTFKDLVVWQNGHNLVIEIYRLTKSFPKDENFGLTSQIRRSAASICANIAEGHKKSTKDFLRFLDISQGSLEETKYHLLLSKDLEYCTQSQYDDLSIQLDEIGKMLNGLSKKLRSR